MPSKHRRYRIANHLISIPSVAYKVKIVGKTLKPGGFSNRYCALLHRIVMNKPIAVFIKVSNYRRTGFIRLQHMIPMNRRRWANLLFIEFTNSFAVILSSSRRDIFFQKPKSIHITRSAAAIRGSEKFTILRLFTFIYFVISEMSKRS